MVNETHRDSAVAPEAVPGVDPRKQIFGDFRAGVWLSIAVAILTIAFEQIPPGETLRFGTYRVLQHLLIPAEELPVTVIDTTNLKQDETTGTTPRYPLAGLIRVVENHNPKVIGIDIDFSPQEGRFITPGDPDFFNFCLAQEKPVFLGILRTQAAPPDEWLGLPKYKSLGAAILVPKEDTRTLTRSFGAYQGLTMSAALVGSYGEASPPSHRWDWLLERVTEKQVNGVQVQESAVDYSILTKLVPEIIKIPAEEFKFYQKLDDRQHDTGVKKIIDQYRDRIAGKMVLIGDATVTAADVGSPDVYPNPLGSGWIRGILLHAAAAYTSVTRPLLEVREPWRTGADLFIAIILLSCIMFVRLCFDDAISGSRLFLILTGSSVILVIVLGLEINRTRVLWDGFVLVAVALALHPFVEEPFLHLRAAFNKWIHHS